MGVSTDIEGLLGDATLTAHLATSVDDRPHVAPVWYAAADGTILVLTDGKKLANTERNPRVAVSIEKNAGGVAEWTITLLGTARVRREAARINGAAREVFSKYLGPDETARPEYQRRARRSKSKSDPRARPDSDGAPPVLAALSYRTKRRSWFPVSAFETANESVRRRGR